MWLKTSVGNCINLQHADRIYIVEDECSPAKYCVKAVINGVVNSIIACDDVEAAQFTLESITTRLGAIPMVIKGSNQ